MSSNLQRSWQLTVVRKRLIYLMVQVLYSRVSVDLESDNLIALLDPEVGQLDLEEVGGILDVEEVLPHQAEGHPGGQNRQQVLQHRAAERQRDAGKQVLEWLIVALKFDRLDRIYMAYISTVQNCQDTFVSVTTDLTKALFHHFTDWLYKINKNIEIYVIDSI